MERPKTTKNVGQPCVICGQSADAQAAIAALQAQLTQLDRTLADVYAQRDGLQRERDALKIGLNALRDSYDELESRHNDTTAALDAEREKAEVYRKALSLISVKTTPWFEGHHGTVEDILAAYAAYVLKQRTLPATPTERGENHSGDDTDMVQKGGGDGE